MMSTGPGRAPDNARVSNHAAGSLLSATQAQLEVIDDDRPMCDAESIGLHDCSWREIFKHKVKGAPTLGLDFLRASKDTTTLRYKLEAPRKGPWNNEEDSHATLTLQQDLGKLGLGAVVWDCVSVQSVEVPLVPVRASRTCRHYIGNRHYCSYCHDSYWLFPL